jgi:drug/metabolite transporter (DMT)-like permease
MGMAAGHRTSDIRCLSWRDASLRPRDTLDLLLLAAIWGGSFLLMRIAAPEFGPVPLIATRVVIAAAFLLVVVASRGGARQIYEHAFPLIVMGGLASALPFSLYAYALLSITGGFASVLNATVPLFGAVVAYIWLRDRLSPTRIAGLVVGLAGVVVLVWGKVSFTTGGSGWAILAGLTAALCYGIAASFTKRKLSHVDPLVTAAGSQAAAAVLLAVPAVIYWPAARPSTLSWISAIVLGILCTGVALYLFFHLIARVGPSKAITVTYLMPAFGVFWGYLILDEAVTLNMLVGCAVILVGTGLASGVIRWSPVRQMGAVRENGE